MVKKQKKTTYKKIRKTKKKTGEQPIAEPQPQQKVVEIAKAKGRPMLVWVGKKPLDRLTAFPAQKIEEFSPSPERGGTKGGVSDWSPNYPNGGLLFHGDNKEVLAHLLANGFRGKVKLIYIDPPFDSGADYVRKVVLRGGNTKLAGEDYSLGEQVQYTDIWMNDNYLQFLYERLQLLREVLDPNGFLCLHLNTTRVHYVKLLLDEIFSEKNFRNEIIVKRIRKSYTEEKGITSLNEGCDYLLLYSSSPESRMFAPMKYSPKEERWHSFDAPNVRKNLTYELFGKYPPAGRCWMNSPEEAKIMKDKGDLRPNPETGWPEYRLEATDYIVRDALWDDVTASAFTTGYPTEKKENMLELLMEMVTKPGDIVLDAFIGSGTTAAVAQKLGRRWIGCDINKGAIQTTSKRLQTIITEQIEQETKKTHQGKLELGEDNNEQTIAPAQNSFAVYRVNDYDLQIQHNEAVNLACEHIGITRTRTDSFFDGTRGKKLVKIVPFNHPCTQLDLEQIKNELKSRPEETRDIVVVSLGKEIAVDAWLENWNKLRKAKEFPNKIELIELRTDQKFGKFIEHKPASARVSIKREKDKVKILIENFISPTIIERLSQQDGVLQPRIEDWRSMVDSVMIDPNYDGKVFNITLSDVPEKKNDFVVGKYELPIGNGKTTVAVKIIDMLGEEVLMLKEV